MFGCTPRGSCNSILLRRVLRRCLVRVSEGHGVLRKVLRGGLSQKALIRSLEGRNTPFRRARTPSRAPYVFQTSISAFLAPTSGGSSHILFRETIISGVEKPIRSSSKGFLNRTLFAYKNGRFASSFLLLGIGLSKASKRQICLSKVPLRNPIETGPGQFLHSQS